jgi:predicted DNA-binding transcriptional regulator
MRPIFLHLAPVLCPIFLLAVVVSLVEAGWLGYLFGGKDATPVSENISRKL